MFFPIHHEGLVHDIFWNLHFIIIKCGQEQTEHRYVIRNTVDYSYPEFKVKHFINEKDYQDCLYSLHIQEDVWSMMMEIFLGGFISDSV